MSDTDASWFVGLAVFSCLVCYLSSSFFKDVYDRTLGSTKGKKKRVKKGKRGNNNGSNGSPKTANSTVECEQEEVEEAEAEADSPNTEPEPEVAVEPRQKKSKTLRLKSTTEEKRRDAVQEALNNGAEDEDGFTVAVAKHTLKARKRYDNMTADEKKEYNKRKAKGEDEKWEVAGSKVTKSSNAYSFQTSVSGRKVPGKKQERSVQSVSTEQRDEFMKRLATMNKDLPQPVIDFRISVQGKWYPLQELLDTNDFEHAPQMVKCFALAPENCLGGMFVTVGGAEWMGVTTADEPWMMTGLVKPLLQLLAGEEGPLTTAMFIHETTNPTTQLSVKTEGDLAVLSLQHLRPPPKVSGVTHKVALKDFTEVMLKQFVPVVEFSRRIQYAVEEVRVKHEGLLASNPVKAQRMLDGLAEVCVLLKPPKVVVSCL